MSSVFSSGFHRIERLGIKNPIGSGKPMGIDPAHYEVHNYLYDFACLNTLNVSRLPGGGQGRTRGGTHSPYIDVAKYTAGHIRILNRIPRLGIIRW